MLLTPTQETVFIRFLWELATDAEKTQIKKELGVPETVAEEPPDTEVAPTEEKHPNYFRPDSERPPRPFELDMDTARAIVNHAIENGYTEGIINSILQNSPLWTWKTEKMTDRNIKTLQTRGYNFSIQPWKWNACLNENKLPVIVKILKGYFPDWEYNSDWKLAE